MRELVTLKDFKDTIGSSKLTVVDFHAAWCGPCKMIAPVFKQLAESHENANFIKVDVDEAVDIAAECGIQAMPTFMLFRDGTKVAEVVGANPQALKSAVNTNYEA